VLANMPNYYLANLKASMNEVSQLHDSQ
jgi:hypothetical protein